MNKVEEFERLYDLLTPDSQEALQWALTVIAKTREPTAKAACKEPDKEERSRAKWRAKLRADIKGHVWEPDLKSELLDRAVALVEAGVVSSKELKATIERSERNPNSEGDGVARRWRYFAAMVKKWTTRTGETWTPCSEFFEPRD